MMNANVMLQSQIETQQLLDDVEYALRSIKTCGSTHSCVGVHAGQLHRGAAAAAKVLGCETATVLYSQGGHGTVDKLREAKGILRETLAETKAIVKGFGKRSQLRLALAGEECGQQLAVAA